MINHLHTGVERGTIIATTVGAALMQWLEHSQDNAGVRLAWMVIGALIVAATTKLFHVAWNFIENKIKRAVDHKHDDAHKAAETIALVIRHQREEIERLKSELGK